jgi:tRNA (guanine37-N1)-methyltransferase
MLKVIVFTLFPETFPGTLGVSVPGRALKDGKWSLQVINIKDYTLDKHKTADEYPFGGGSGMLLKVDVLGRAVDDLLSKEKERPLIILTSARGETFSQKIASEFSQASALNKSIFIICGRFEGVDERFIEYYGAQEINIGKFVLFGGEVAAMAILEAVVRLLEGVVGSCETHKEESYALGGEFEELMEYPQYTAPRSWNGMEVPEILFSGHHSKIKEWRLKKAKEITAKFNAKSGSANT